MKIKLVSVVLALMVSVSMISTDAFAKRMGSASNSGMQRNVAPTAPTNSNTINKAPAPTTATNSATGATTKSSWMGPLMGLAAGGLLAAAFMGGAFDGISPMDIIVLLAIAGGVFFLLRRRAQTTTAQQPIPVMTTPNSQYRHNESVHGTGSSDVQIGRYVETSSSATNSMAGTINQPTWFDEQAFTQQAETWYVALQAAWDKKDWTMLSAITTSEFFTELKAQRLAENEHNTTHVEEVHAKVREMLQDTNGWLLTVHFSGYISEQEGAFPHAFSEFWHLVRIGEADGEWKLAGIQQD